MMSSMLAVGGIKTDLQRRNCVSDWLQC